MEAVYEGQGTHSHRAPSLVRPPSPCRAALCRLPAAAREDPYPPAPAALTKVSHRCHPIRCRGAGGIDRIGLLNPNNGGQKWKSLE